MDDIDPNPPRETTGRRMITGLGSSKLHKTMNWTTLLGVAGTAVVGYLADGNRGEKQERLADGAAREIAALHEWRDSAKAELRSQGEQVARLREAVAALKAANEAMAQGYGRHGLGARVRAAVENADEIMDEAEGRETGA